MTTDYLILFWQFPDYFRVNVTIVVIFNNFKPWKNELPIQLWNNFQFLVWILNFIISN